MADLDLRAVRVGLANAIANADHVSVVYPYVVDEIKAVPAVYVSAGEPTEYNRRFGRGASSSTFYAVVVCGRVDVEESQALMDLLASQMSTDADGKPVTTIKTAIEADPSLGGACAAALVERAENFRAVRIAGNDYLAFDLVVSVHT